MFCVATSVKFLKNVTVECVFEDGKIIRYDLSKMFTKYPQLEELKNNRELFESGKLDSSGLAIEWNDELDFETWSIHDLGEIVGEYEIPFNKKIGVLLCGYRVEQGLTQKELAKLSGINQADISRIEDGKGNPTLKKIETLFNALGKKLDISVK